MPGMIKVESSPPGSDQASHSLLSLHSTPSPASSSAAAASLAPPAAALPPNSSSSGEERGIRLIQLLYLCADAVSGNNIEHANFFLEQLSSLASITGDPIQRVATYFMQGLATRITKRWPGIHRALRLTHPSLEPELPAARQILFNVCPYLKFGFITVNQTILDTMQGEKVVHVVDLEVCGVNSSLQWVALLQAFSSRAEGPPHLRITAVNSRREVLSQMGQVLSETAERLDIPFQYHPLGVSPADLRGEMLRVRTGEAVAITSVMQLHRLLSDDDDDDERPPPSRLHEVSEFSSGNKLSRGGDHSKDRKRSREEFERSVPRARNGVHRKLSAEATKAEDDDQVLGLALSVSGASRDTVITTRHTIDRVLELLHGLSPKVVVVVEQESSHNSRPLRERFAPALHYYSAIFDSLNSTLPRQSSERISVERLVFGQEIENIVACEGPERVERHESLEKWRRRLEKHKFSSAHLSPTTLVQAERLLTIHSPDGYKLQREKGSLTLCWQDTPLLSVSAWEP